MAKPPELHFYSDRSSFDRLMVLIATLVQYPGVGSRNAKTSQDQDSLETLQQHMQAVAKELNLPLPDYSVHTLRKDLGTLRNYGILDRNRHDWGYYLGTGAMNREELQLVLNALASQATYQGDPQAKRIYQALSQRLRCQNLESKGALFYPVRAQFNRAIVPTDPDEMIRKQQSRDTLFHSLEQLEQSIVQGLPIEIYFFRNLYNGKPDYRRIYPLQLLYYDIAWYLVTENIEDGHLAVSRVDRFKQHLEVLEITGREVDVQLKSLQAAHQLLRNGWGLSLGNLEEQRQERQGTLPLVKVKVRFFPPASRFIAEGEQRHSKQKIICGPKDDATGEFAYVDYAIALPKRSLDEFGRWVAKHLENAQVLAPPDLVEKHRQAAAVLMKRYQ
ncbi:WYL domain-containing protein [Oculatella sp. FACHB-28]|uniref:helix-turn-helix transcriptional regulator n=1 Tax=Oculatella sp. FACHB-28 TaxID=2692845 RepID=UPI001685AB02|nr:WYL domain-containing protein [Oculatella sp. FACHB-28]MBD2054634.1 WYL domain-containing protein [Oculatella sp. FACHB-28]